MSRTSVGSRSWFEAVSLAVFAFLTAFGVGCGADVPNELGPVDQRLAAQGDTPSFSTASPRSVLLALIRAYEARDVDAYSPLFAPQFVFEFAPEDVDQGNTPASWPLNDELNAARNMFEDDHVELISLEFEIPPARPAVESDNLPSIQGVWVIEVEGVYLSVLTHNELGEPLELQVVGDRATFFFRLGPLETGPNGNRRQWQLIRWRDDPQPPGATPASTSLRPATEQASWGQIKNLYR